MNKTVSQKRFSPGNAALILALLTLTLLLALQLSRRNTTQPTSGMAPDFTLRLFDGGEIRLSDLRGKVALLNFWASWCPPCRDEAPDLVALHNDFADAGLVIIGINMLEASAAKALAFIDEYGITYANGEDEAQRITTAYHVEAPPESFFIDKSGQVRRFVLGALQYEDARQTVLELLSE